MHSSVADAVATLEMAASKEMLGWPVVVEVPRDVGRSGLMAGRLLALWRP